MSNYKKITQEEKNEKFIQKSREVWGYKYDYSKVEYIDALTQVTIIYNGKHYRQTPTKHLQGKNCENQIKKMSTEEFIEKSKLIWGDHRFEYTKCEYTDSHSKIILFDNEKKEWVEQAAKSHLSGYEVIKYGDKKFKEICNLKHDFKYNYSNFTYHGMNSFIELECKIHGKFNIKCASHFYGSLCTKCNEFFFNKNANRFLKNYNIVFERQKEFNNCYYDYFIPSLNTIIDFQEKNHFEPVEYFGGLEAHSKLKQNDLIKSQYCEENYINLIRIRYDEIDEIHNILWGYLSPFIRAKRLK